MTETEEGNWAIEAKPFRCILNDGTVVSEVSRFSIDIDRCQHPLFDFHMRNDGIPRGTLSVHGDAVPPPIKNVSIPRQYIRNQDGDDGNVHDEHK